MRRVLRILKLILWTLLATVVAFVLLLVCNPRVAERYQALMEWAQPRLMEVQVYGENAHFLLHEGFGQDVQLGAAGLRYATGPTGYINQGLHLGFVAEGDYHLYAASLSILAPADYTLEGYTITRGGQNNHYRFYVEDGRLQLAVRVVDELPAGVYDIIIDPGHGGSDTGTAPAGRLEKTENLMASIYMQELFQQRGLKVALTRTGDYEPGQPGVASADINPYVEDGRVDLVYQSQAKYMLSSHLNASATGAYRGYQLYSSVRADEDWQRSIARQLDLAGHVANDSFQTFGRYGIYKRYSQDDPETDTDYYFVLRETGGDMTTARRFTEAFPDKDLRQGVESILLEYLFLDNRQDREYWDNNWRTLVEAAVEGSCRYWGLE